jgi:hypothetical protein
MICGQDLVGVKTQEPLRDITLLRETTDVTWVCESDALHIRHEHRTRLPVASSAAENPTIWADR